MLNAVGYEGIQTDRQTKAPSYDATEQQAPSRFIIPVEETRGGRGEQVYPSL
jgi:hypothetical protein